MTERRRFNDRERVALYLAADGRCSNPDCGAALEPGWHADHIDPRSRGGLTDVINGQALCPSCNLKKGASMSDLRQWQSAALAKLIGSGDDFLTVATPGAGKTTFALVAAQRLIDLGQVQRVIVVVPTAHLRTQWATAGAQLGVQLDHRFTNGVGVIAKDFDGTVITYDTVASQPLLWRKLATDQRTLVILDETHHASDELTWGTKLRTAFEGAKRRLLMSGTPFRSDKSAIPFVQYDENGRCVPSYNYDYGQALQDRTVVRPIEFLALDGSVRWRDAGAIVSTALADADEEALANALRTALSPDGDWIASVFRRADAELTRHRTEVVDAGGLVIASDQDKARRYAQLLERICGEAPTLAISDEPEASAKITDFVRGSSRWIVAVQMVSEGVDIPRLSVGVYASRIRTEMFFRQVVGRFVRMRGAEDDTCATLLIPSIQPLISYAHEIEKTVVRVLSDEEQKLRREAKDWESQGTLRLDLVEPIDSEEATHHATILSGDSFPDDELQRARAAHEAVNLPSSVSYSQVARLLRMAGAGRVVGTAVMEPPTAKPLGEQKAALRRLIKTKVGRLSNLKDTPHSHIHGQLNRACGDTAKTATAATLERRLDLLDGWIREAAL